EKKKKKKEAQGLSILQPTFLGGLLRSTISTEKRDLESSSQVANGGISTPSRTRATVLARNGRRKLRPKPPPVRRPPPQTPSVATFEPD
ncbi:hypothetical protein VIGAN_06092400, partial [Vigna angularis var. angularis]